MIVKLKRKFMGMFRDKHHKYYIGGLTNGTFNIERISSRMYDVY